MISKGTLMQLSSSIQASVFSLSSDERVIPFTVNYIHKESEQPCATWQLSLERRKTSFVQPEFWGVRLLRVYSELFSFIFESATVSAVEKNSDG